MNKEADSVKDNELNACLDSVLESFSSPMARIDTLWNIVQFNHAFLLFIKRVFNIDVEPGISLLKCFDGNPDNNEVLKQNLLSGKDGNPVRFTTIWGNVAESTCFYSNSLQPIFSQEKELAGFIFVIKDISNLKQAERNSRITEEKFRVAFESSIVARSITSVDGTLHVNQAFCDILGYSKEELNQINWRLITHKDDLERNDEIVKSIMSGATNGAHWEKRYIHKNGSLVWAHVTTALVRDEDGTPLYYVSEFIDITRQKEQEQELRQSEERYRLLAENSTDVIWEIGLDKKFKYVSPSVFQLRGFTVEEVMNQSLEEVVVPESLAVVEQGFADAFRVYSEGGEVSGIYREIAQPCKDGTVVWTEVSLNLLFDEQGQMKGFIGNSRNINDRKKTEDALRESEKLYKHLVNAMPDGVYKSSSDGRFIEVNPAMVKMLGYENKAELMAIDIASELYFSAQDRKLTSGELASQFNEVVIRLRKKDGSELWVEDHGWYVLDEAGNVVFREGILRDITQRKQMEEAKELDHSLLSATLESTGDGLLVVNLDGVATIYNRKFLKMWDISAELPDRALNGTLLHFLEKKLTDSGKFSEKVKELHRYPELSSVDNLWLKDERVFESHSMPQWLHGKIIGRVWSFRDITERVRAEKELNANRELLEKMLKLSNQLLETDLEKFGFNQLSDEVMNLSGAKFCSFNLYDESGDGFTTVALSGFPNVRQKAKKFLGFDVIGKRWKHNPGWNEKPTNKILTEFNSLLDMVDQLIPKPVVSLIQSTFNLGKVAFLKISVENVQVGDFAMIFEKGKVVEHKQALELFASQLGIFISKKRILEKIQRSEENYRLLFNNMVDAFALHEIILDKKGIPGDYRFLQINPMFEHLTGKTSVEIIGRTCLEVFPQTEAYWIDLYGKVAQGGETIFFENYSKEVEKYFQVAAYSPEPGKFVTLFSDITERKQAEIELKERMEEVTRFNRLTVDRELVMIELKKEINELLVKSGLEPKYKIVQ